jgi:predicted metal-dependent HD superfamily phosphohydrolase
MLEEAFKSELTRLGVHASMIEHVWSEIYSKYSASSRHYHNLSHLDSLIEMLLPIQDQIKDWRGIVFSVAYHDIVYNPLSKENEEKSAQLAGKRLTQLSLHSEGINKCIAQILATKHHELTDDSDTNHFTDSDLAILGSDAESYLNYTRLIRKEYRYFPDFIYKPGRQKVLTSFLKMEAIFKTEYFGRKYEAQARLNILNEIKSLTA